MYKKTLVLLFLAVAFIQVQGQEFLPSLYPDRINLTWTKDPSNSQAVTWRTDLSVKTGKVQYKVEDSTPDTEKEVKETAGQIKVLTLKEGRKDHYHSATLTGLQPKTKYMYRVGDGTHWSEWFNFTTAEPVGSTSPFSFIYLGDGQNDLKSRWSRAVRKAYSHLPEARFIVHAGDLINRANTDAEWGEWHYATSFIHGSVPAVVTPGNHEYFRDSLRNLFLDPHWTAQFALPENGIDEATFFIDYQNVRLISLNSQLMILEDASRERQKQWLEKVLKENKQKWVIVIHHHPVYSTAKNRDNKELRETVKPLYDKYGVDLVLQGHDHTYARGKGPGATAKSPMYMLSVSGPKMYKSDSDRWMDVSLSDTQLYQTVEVTNTKIVIKVYKLTGELFDTIELKK